MQPTPPSQAPLNSAPGAFSRLRVRVEDANGPLPGDSPPAPAIPLHQGSATESQETQRPQATHAPRPRRSSSSNSSSYAAATARQRQHSSKSRPLRSHTCSGSLGDEHRLTSVIPLDIARLEATLVDVRLRAVEMGNQILEAQWAAPGSRRAGARRTALPLQVDGPPFSKSLSEPLPALSNYSLILPSSRMHPPSAVSSLASLSILNFQQVHPPPFSFPAHPPHAASLQPRASILGPPHAPHHLAPLRPSPPVQPHPTASNRVMHRVLSRSRAPSTAASCCNSRPASRAISRAVSRAGSARSDRSRSRTASGTGEGAGGGGEFLEMEAAPPTPIIEPEVIRSTSTRLVELVQQRQKEAAAAAVAAAAAAAASLESGFLEGVEEAPELTFATDCKEGAGSTQAAAHSKPTRKPKYSTAGLHGKALVEKALATIDKAFRLLLKVQDEEQRPQGKDDAAAAGSGRQTDPGASDALQQCAQDLTSLQREMNLGGGAHQGAPPGGSEAPRKLASMPSKLPPLNLRPLADQHGCPLLGIPGDRTSAPLLHHPAERPASGHRPCSEPQGSQEDISLVEAVRVRAQHAQHADPARDAQAKARQQLSPLEAELKLRMGLRTAKKILKGLKEQQKDSGQADESSMSSLSEDSETELTEQEQAHGRGIWGVVGNAAMGGRVAIPVVPRTPDVYSGAFGRVERQRQRLRAQQDVLCSRNPVAYEEDLARQSENHIRHLALEAQKKLGHLGACAMKAPEFMKSIKLLQSQRPFYLPPMEARENVRRKSLEASAARAQHTWKISKSVFDTRRQMSDAQDVVDTDKAKQDQFDLDYSRVAEKPLFLKLLKRIDENVRQSSGSLEDEIRLVYKQMSAYRDPLRSIFIFYSCVASRFTCEDHGRVSLSSWLQFCSDARIMDNAQKGCTRADLSTVFVAVKGGTDKGNEAISDDAMMRFEFYEGIVRAAYIKYVEPRHLDDLSDAVVMIIEACVLPHVPREALLDPNAFRNERLHSQAMASLLTDHWQLLTALFKLFKAKDRTRYFRVEHWGSFLEANKLLALQAGLDKRDAKLIFSWSQMSVTDELKKRKRTVALSFMDFVEAVCRLGEHLALPSDEDLDAFFIHEQGIDPKRVAQGPNPPSGRAGYATGPGAALASPTGAVLKPAATTPTPSGMQAFTQAPPWSQPDEPGKDTCAATSTAAAASAAAGGGRQGAGGALAGTPGAAAGERAGVDPAGYSLKLQEFQRLIAVSGQRKRRPSAGLLSPPSRGLEAKVGLLLTHVLGNMQRLYGGHDEADTARKMLHHAEVISCGIELA